jgi:hypothetical protein
MKRTAPDRLRYRIAFFGDRRGSDYLREPESLYLKATRVFLGLLFFLGLECRFLWGAFVSLFVGGFGGLLCDSFSDIVTL